jgi:hypothetical protein
MQMELTIEESRFHEIKRIEPGFDSIRLSNSLGIEVYSTALTDHLVTVEGIGHIKLLNISFSSCLKDLKVIKAFPNLSIVRVYGYQTLSMDGLEWFQQADYLVIRTESNRRRTISGLSRAPIKRMDLQFARPEDIDGIAECLTLQSLDLSHSKDIDFSKWNRLPLESLGLLQGKFKELGNTSQVRSLKKLRVLGCHSLERFTGDNSPIVWMWIDGSKKLDLRTVQTFQGIEALAVNGNSNEIALSEIGELRQLKNLGLIDCNVQVDISNLKHQFPRLEEILISQMKEEQVLELSQHNPDVLVKGKTFQVRNLGLRTFKALNGSLVE